MIIVLSGRKQSGKDSAAARLIKEEGFTRIAFADKLKELAAAFLGFDLEHVKSEEFKNRLPLTLWQYTDSLGPNTLGREIELTGRNVLQRLGTDACCKVFGDDFWVNLLKRRILKEMTPGLYGALIGKTKVPDYVITDARFWNEIDGMKPLGAKVIRLNRKDRRGFHHFNAWTDGNDPNVCSTPYEGRTCGLPQASHPTHFSGDVHPSETTLPDENSLAYDHVIEAGSGEEAAAAVLAYVRSL